MLLPALPVSLTLLLNRTFTLALHFKCNFCLRCGPLAFFAFALCLALHSLLLLLPLLFAVHFNLPLEFALLREQLLFFMLTCARPHLSLVLQLHFVLFLLTLSGLSRHLCRSRLANTFAL